MPQHHSIWRRPPFRITLLSLTLRLTTFFLLTVIPHILPSWDPSSRDLLPPRSPAEGLLRWDTVHFIGIAEREGGKHEKEKEWAFGRGIVEALRAAERAMEWAGAWAAGDSSIEIRRERMVLGGSLVTMAASLASGVTLYYLTLHVTKDRRFAQLVHFLHTLSPAPATLVVPYTEPFYALFTFVGCLTHFHGMRFPAATSWAIATWFRPLGVLNAGFFAWEWLEDVARYRRRKAGLRGILVLSLKLARALALAAIIFAPFARAQREAYLRFCATSSSPRPWCSRRPPLIYSWVQEYYWEVGWFKYWTIKQSPLFALSAPVYALLLWTLYQFYTSVPVSTLLPGLIRGFAPPRSSSRLPLIRNTSYFAPHMHQTLVLVALLLFHSHVQIVLRQVFTMPVAWWGAAALVARDRGWLEEDKAPRVRKSEETGEPSESEDSVAGFLRPVKVRQSCASGSWGQAWIRWCIAWGSISIVLWGVFLPPA